MTTDGRVGAPGITGLCAEEVIDVAGAALIVVDEGGCIQSSNKAADELLRSGTESLSGLSLFTFLPELSGSPRGFQAGPAPSPWTRLRVQGLSGSTTALVHVAPAGAGQSVVSLHPDVGPSAGESELQQLVSLLNATLESTADGILAVGLDGRITGINSQFVGMWKIPDAVLASHDDAAVMEVILEQLADPAAFTTKIAELYGSPEAESLDVIEFLDGRVFERFCRPQRINDRIVGRVWSFRDVTSHRDAELKAERALQGLSLRAAELRELAYRDPLTGLCNRAQFNLDLERIRTSPRGDELALLLMDLDDFKEINDIHGHIAGDQMLIAVAGRLEGCIGSRGTVARIGGDEFVVLLRRGVDAEGIAAEILGVTGAPLVIGGVELRPSLSIGIATPKRDCGSADCSTEILRHADIAMYAAKAAGKNRARHFQPEMMESLLERAKLHEDLTSAVENGEITAVYQPIVDSTGAIVQLETLARWNRAGQPCSPDVFIPAAENAGLMNTLGANILEQACTEAGQWLTAHPGRSIAVNISGSQVCQPHYAASVLDLLATFRVAPTQLTLEVTESVFLGEDTHVITQLSQLRYHGVRIAVDDFGTGYSSFGRLHELPVDALKLDRSFIQRIQAPGDHSPVIESMIDMAHNLGLKVTAEGIETQGQAGYLRGLGCDFQQGYLYAHPAPFGTLFDPQGGSSSPGS